MGEILSQLWNGLLFHPFMNIILLLYSVLGDNLGLAVILFAIVSRLALIPSTRKQMEMTKKMSSMKPKLDELQKKYKNNREKLAQEQMKLYREVGYNPIGCLGSFLPQLFILAAIIGVIRTLTNGDFDGLYPFVKDFVFNGDTPDKLKTHFVIWDLAKNYSAIASKSGYLALDGLAYLLLAVAVALLQYVSTRFMQIMQGTDSAKPKSKTNIDEPLSQEEIQAQMSKSMNAMLPVMTGIFTLSAPAVLGVYWLVQSAMSIVQYFLIDRDASVRAFDKITSALKFARKKKD